MAFYYNKIFCFCCWFVLLIVILAEKKKAQPLILLNNDFYENTHYTKSISFYKTIVGVEYREKNIDLYLKY